MGHCQLTRLDTSPYQRELLERGLNCQAQGEYSNRRMEQGMGYTSSVGMMLMDKLVGVCERNKERFTGVRTDLGKVEEEIEKACDCSSQVQDQVTALETNVWRLEASRRVMREEVADLMRGMYLLVELNQRLMGIRAHLYGPFQLLFFNNFTLISLHFLPFTTHIKIKIKIISSTAYTNTRPSS